MLSVRRPTKTGSVTISIKNVIYRFAFRSTHSGQLNKSIIRNFLIICFDFATLNTLNVLVFSLVYLFLKRKKLYFLKKLELGG